MSSLSTHVLDTSRGTPAVGIQVSLAALEGSTVAEARTFTTDASGRIGALLPHAEPGRYRLSYDLDGYLRTDEERSFYPLIEVDISIDPERHHHVVLTLSPFGYFVACVPS